MTVTYQEGSEDVESVTFNIQRSADTLPEIDASLSHHIFTGESINLNGSASTSIAASKPLGFTWLNDSQIYPQIEIPDALQKVAIAPTVTATEIFTFSLRFKDARGNQWMIV